VNRLSIVALMFAACSEAATVPSDGTDAAVSDAANDAGGASNGGGPTTSTTGGTASGGTSPGPCCYTITTTVSYSGACSAQPGSTTTTCSCGTECGLPAGFVRTTTVSDLDGGVCSTTKNGYSAVASC
jgi:hypothetical protein